MLQSLEARYGVTVVILMDSAMITGHYRLVKVTKDGREVLHEDSKQPRQRSRKRGRRGARGRDDAVYTDVDIPAEGRGRAQGAYEPDGDDEDNEPIGGREPREPARSAANAAATANAATVAIAADADAAGATATVAAATATATNAAMPRASRVPNAPADIPQEPQLDENGQPIAAASGPRPERGEQGERSRRRGRRGGRGRNRSERGEPREPRSDNDNVAARRRRASSRTSSSPSGASRPRRRRHRRRPRASFVVPLSEAQTNPAALASPIRTEAAPEGDKPKRKGWWSKMTE